MDFPDKRGENPEERRGAVRRCRLHESLRKHPDTQEWLLCGPWDSNSQECREKQRGEGPETSP